MIGSSVGLPGAALGFAIGTAGDFVLTTTLNNIYIEGPLRDNTAEALFDDISIDVCAKNEEVDSTATKNMNDGATTTTTTTTESHDVQIVNKGSPIYNVYLATEPFESTPSSSTHPHEIAFISTNSMGTFRDIPDAFLSNNPLLQCDADIGGQKVQLTWPLQKLVTRQDKCDDANVPSDQIVEKSYSIDIHCTSQGQLCEPAFSVPIDTRSRLQVKYIVPSHCSPISLHIYVDGILVKDTGILGWPGAIGEFSDLPLDTGFIDLEPVSPGRHIVSLQAEGHLGGCNSGGYLMAWEGTLVVRTSGN